MIAKKELLKRLRAKNIKIGGNPERMLARFISLGLIDKPVCFGLGQGKGSVSKFKDKDIQKIEKIVSLKAEGLTYDQIKLKLRSIDDWLPVIRDIVTSSPNAEGAIRVIQNIPSLSDSEKGKLKMTVDVADHLTNIVIKELFNIFSDLSSTPSASTRLKELLSKDICNVIEFMLPNVFHDLGLGPDEFAEYLSSKMHLAFKPSPSVNRFASDLLNGPLIGRSKSTKKKGDNKSGRQN